MNLVDLQPGRPIPEPRTRPPAPMLPIALGMMAGILIDAHIQMPIALSAAVVVAWAAAMIQTRGRLHAGWAALGVAAAGMGAARHALAERWLPPDHVARFLSHSTDSTERLEAPIVKVRGQIITPPVTREPDPAVRRPYPVAPRTTFVLEVRAMVGDDEIPMSGRVAVLARTPKLGLRVGDIVEVTGRLAAPSPPRNPGEMDWAAHQRRSGIRATLRTDHGESIRAIDATDAGGWRRLIADARTRLRGYLIEPGFEDDDPGAGVLSAMVLGERSAVSRAMNEAFLRTGNAHLLAASGMQVAWLALVGWIIARAAGIHYRLTALFVAALIVSYVLLTEPQPSILRAGIVGVVACGAAFFRGRYGSMNALAVSVVIVLLIRPGDLFSAGFQLTYLATLGLLHFCPRVAEAISEALGRLNLYRAARAFGAAPYGLRLIEADRPEAGKSAMALRWAGVGAAQLFALSLAEWLLTAPLGCYFFGAFMPWGWLGTFVASAIALPATWIGYLSVLAGLLLPSSGVVFGPPARVSIDLLTGCVERLAQLPGSVVDGRAPSLAWVVACYGALAVWCYRPKWIAARRRHGFKIIALVLVLWWLVPPRWVRADRGALCVWMLAVGNGTGTVIELPDGQTIIYDFGTRSGFDAGPVAENFLRYRGIRRVDAVFVSHTDFDHFSAIEHLAHRVQIGRVLVNDHFEHFAADEPAARAFLEGIRARGIPVETIHAPAMRNEYEPVRLEVLWPPSSRRQTFFADNDASTVLRLSFEGRSVLLPGDIAEAGIAGLLSGADEAAAIASRPAGKEANLLLHADVLALPHHGSVVPNTKEFIEAVNPGAAIRSTARRRSAGAGGVEELVLPRAYFSTADDGCILVRIKNGELVVIPALPKE